MKKFLSLLLVAVMVFGVIGLVGCKGGQNETTTTTTTQGAQTTTTTTKETTTTVGTTTTTTTATTPKETTTTTTTTTATTPKETTTETTTTTTTTTEPMVTTTHPTYVRFDFGTNSRAVDEGKTSHEWLVENLDKGALEGYMVIEYLEDSWKIWAKKDYTTLDYKNMTEWGLCFNNILSLDFEDSLYCGWGTWEMYPYSSKNIGVNGKWGGNHQYMKIRIKNNTENNMIGLRWADPASGNAYATTMAESNMYLQGGVNNKVCEPTEEWRTYIYDLALCQALVSNKLPSGLKEKTYSGIVEAVAAGGYNLGNNWHWHQRQEISGLIFYVLGAAGVNYYASTDSRDNIKKGTWVEVDYIIFGSTPEQLEAWKSKSEAANA